MSLRDTAIEQCPDLHQEREAMLIEMEWAKVSGHLHIVEALARRVLDIEDQIRSQTRQAELWG